MSIESQTETPVVRDGDPAINHSLENETPVPEISLEGASATTLEETNPNHVPASTETPAQGTGIPASTVQTKPAEGTVTPGGTETPLEFKPNFKYKVREEEHEMDDWVRKSITNEETFKKAQDLYTRGHGLELAKTERDEFKQKFSDLEQSVGAVSGIVKKYYQDPTNPENARLVAQEFIESLGLPKQMFMQYAMEEIKHQQLPPEQRAVIDAQRQQSAQFLQMQQQVETSEQRTERMNVEYHSNLMNMALADPGASQISSEYDAKLGRAGAFREFVIQRGIFHEQTSGNIVLPNQLVKESIAMLGLTPQGTATQTGTVGTQPIQTTQQQPQTLTIEQMRSQQQQPVLPNISGQGSASPIKATYSSIDQIREKHKQLVEAGL